MKEVTMSQSAEQAAIDNVLPDEQSGARRQVSADAFRALTMRLNGKKPTPPVAVPQLSEPVPVPVSVLTSVPVSVPASVPVDKPVETTTPDLAVQSAPSSTAPQASNARTNNPEIEPVNATARLEPVVESAVALDEIDIPELVIDPVAASSVISANEGVSQKPSPYAMPASGTKIILNPTGPLIDTLDPSQINAEPVEPVALAKEEKPEPAQPEPAQPDLAQAEPAQAEPAQAEPDQAKPVSQEIDPLLAAMKLMDSSGIGTRAHEPALEAENNVDSAAVPASEIVEPDLSQNPDVAALLIPQVSEADLVEPALVATTLVETTLAEPALPETKAHNASSAPIAPETIEIVDNHKQEAVVPVVVEVAETQVQSPAKPQPPIKSGPVVSDVAVTVSEQEPDTRSGEAARSLLDMMSSTSGGSQPQERALAADTLLQLVPRMKVKDLVALSRRVCIMDDAPQLLVKALINHREPAVAEPLLEDGNVISEQDLLKLISVTSVDRLIMIAKGRKVTPSVCDGLISRGEASVYLTLVRNPGAALSHDSFVAFCEIAKSQSSLQAPLATRGDTPPPIAFELFWSLPVELRRYVLSRFLTDSATLDKILKLAQSVVPSTEDGNVDKQKFPPKRKVEELVDLIADGVTDQAAAMMADIAGTNQDNARRIITDPDGEPLTVVLKTMGLPRTSFSQAIKKCASSSKAMLRSDRNLNELQIIFDSLSFNKARTLLTYWDWAVEKTGPYTRRVM